MKKLVKTNVMRLLDAAKIAYEAKEYPVDENDLSGSHAADLMGVDHGSVFKTLVLRGEKTGYMVCCNSGGRRGGSEKGGQGGGRQEG